MNFELSEMHAAIQSEARAFSRKLSALAESIETHGVSAALMSELGELGMFGITGPEERGGVGMDALAYALVIESLAIGSPSVARIVAAHAGPAVAGLAAAGLLSEDLLSGGSIASYRPSDESLAPLSDGPLIDAGTIYARASGDALQTTGHRGAGLGRPAGEGESLAQVDPIPLKAWHDLGLAALALGSGESAYQTGVGYALERQQFGRPIARFQAIQWKIANSATHLEAARQLVFRAASTLEPSHCASARVMASRAALLAADEALQIHGGYGYTEEYPVERHLRSVRMCASNDSQRAAASPVS